ncbi:unnamed protein product [Sphagnum troendelagicum]|uniref:BAT2 N-terminal domain-containing protein n=1 Tax=Sphagnum troendelagicum TaxID=128251 RepID=A0ABP0UT52_9BRYO
MARASNSNTKFASVNLNRSYGRPAVVSPPNSMYSGGTVSGSAATRSRSSSTHGGMLLLTRPTKPQPPGTAVQKGSKVIVPGPVNLPSLRREHAGNDPTITLVGATGSSGWTKTQHEEETVVPAASTFLESTASAVKPGVYTPPRVHSQQLSPSPSTAKISGIEKAVVLRGEDFPTLQAALPPQPAAPQQRQKEMRQKQQEKQQEIKDQQRCLQQLSEQQQSLKTEVASASLFDGVLQQTKTQQPPVHADEVSPSSERQSSSHPGPSAQSATLMVDASPASHPRQHSNWTDDERDSIPVFRPQGHGGYPEHSNQEGHLQHPIRSGRDQFGLAWPPSHRKTQPSFALGRAASPSWDNDQRHTTVGGDRDSVSVNNSSNRDGRIGHDNNGIREAGNRNWGGGSSRDSGSNGQGGFFRAGHRGEKEGGYGRLGTGGRESFHGRMENPNKDRWLNREEGFNMDGSLSLESASNRESFLGRESMRRQGGDLEGGYGSLGDGGRSEGSDSSKPGSFLARRTPVWESQMNFGRENSTYGGYHVDFGGIHGLDSFSPAAGVGIEPPLSSFSGLETKVFRKRRVEVKDSEIRDSEREAFEAELERVQKAQEQDRERKIKEKERAVEIAQKELEEHAKLVREEIERKAKLEEEAKEAAKRAEEEALEAAQKLEDERKLWEDKKRQVRLEEERRKENARQKLLELEERIARREAEKLKEEEESRLRQEERLVSLQQVQEKHELPIEEEVERKGEERLVDSSTGAGQDGNGNEPVPVRNFPSIGRHKSSELQASMPSDSLHKARSYDDRGDSFYMRGINSVSFPFEGGPGETYKKESDPQSAEHQWVTEEPGLSNKRLASLSTSVGSDERVFQSSWEREGDSRWSRDRDSWRAGRDISGSFASPPHTPSYTQGSDMVEPPPYGRLRHSLAKQPRVPPPPLQLIPQRLPQKLLEPSAPPRASPLPQQSEVKTDIEYVPQQQEIAVDKQQSQEVLKGQEIENLIVARKHADVSQDEMLIPQRVDSSQPRREWQKPLSQPLRPQHLFAQVQGSPLKEVKEIPESSSHEIHSSSSEDPVLLSTQMLSEDKWEENNLTVSTIEEDLDKKDPDEEEDNNGQEGDEEGYEGYDENEEDEDDNGNDGGDYAEEEEDRGLPEQDLRADFENHEAVHKRDSEGQSTVIVHEKLIENGLNDHDVRSEEVFTKHSSQPELEGQSERMEAMEMLQLQEGTQAQSLTTKVTVSTGESNGSIIRHSSPSPYQQPVSYVAIDSLQPDFAPVSSPLPGLQVLSAVPAPLQFGLLPGSSLMQGSVPAIQIGSIQTPLHMLPQTGPQQLMHIPAVQPLTFQFGQLRQTVAISQHLPLVRQVASPSTVELCRDSQGSSIEQHDASAELQIQNPSMQGGDFLLVQPMSLLMKQTDQFAAGVSRTSVELEASEKSSISGKPGPLLEALERKSVDTGVSCKVSVSNPRKASLSHSRTRPREVVSALKNNEVSSPGRAAMGPSTGPKGDGMLSEHSLSSENFWQKSIGTRGGGSGVHGVGMLGQDHVQSITEGSLENNSTSIGGLTQHAGADGVVVRTRPSRRNSFRRSDQRARVSVGAVENASFDGKPIFKQAVSAAGSSEPIFCTVSGINGRERFRITGVQAQERSCAEESNQTSKVTTEARSPQQSGQKLERTSSGEALQKTGVRSLVPPGNCTQPGDGVLGKYSSESAVNLPFNTGSVQVFQEPGGEALSDDFIEVRSKRQMLNDRRDQRAKENKAKSKDLKASQKQRFSEKFAKQSEATSVSLSGNGSKSSSRISDVYPSSTMNEIVNSNSQVGQPGTPPPVAITTLPILPGNSQALPLAPIGTPVPGSSGKWAKVLNLWQVVSLTQIQLEEAMKPGRFEAPRPQQLSIGEPSSMVLDPGMPVPSMARKDKLSSSAAGPIGSLLAGDRIQFGAMTSPPTAISNSHPHTPALNSVVGSSLGSRGEATADESDMMKSTHSSLPQLDIPFTNKGNLTAKHTCGEEQRDQVDGSLDAEAEAEAAASAVAVAAISSDESVGSTHHVPHVGMVLQGMGVSTMMSSMMQSPMLEDAMAAGFPPDLSVEPSSMSRHGSTGQGPSSLLSVSGQSPFAGLEMLGNQMFPFGSSKEACLAPQGIGDQGAACVGWQPQHSSVDSHYGGPSPSSYADQYIDSGGVLPSHMLVYTNPFAHGGQFNKVGFMPTYLPSGKQPDWKHTTVWPSGPGVGISATDSLGGMMGVQRGSGNIQRMASGPSIVPGALPTGSFNLNSSAPFQIPNVDSSIHSQWLHRPVPMHNVPLSGPLMDFTMQQSRQGPTDMLDTVRAFNLNANSRQVSDTGFSSMDAAAQFPDELGLGDTSSSVKTAASQVNQGGNPSSGNGTTVGGNSEVLSAMGSKGGQVPPSYRERQVQSQQQGMVMGMGQAQIQHSVGMGDQRGPQQHGSPRFGSASTSWSGGQGHRKSSGTHGRPPMGDRGTSGEKLVTPSSKLKQVFFISLIDGDLMTKAG